MRIWKLLATVAFSILAGNAFASDGAGCRTARIADGNWTDNIAQNGLAAVLLKPLGYDTHLEVLSAPLIFASLKNKDVDGVVINGANAAAYEREFAGELVVAIKDLESDPLGLVFRKGDENVAAFNEGLKAIKDDGTMAKLVDKYWGLK